MRTFFLCCVLSIPAVLILGGCFGPEITDRERSIEIYDARVSDITTSSAVVTWETDVDAHSYVVYMDLGADGSVSNTLYDDEPREHHRINLSNLKPATNYLLIVHSGNNLGGATFETGKNLFFSTLSSQ